LKVYDSMDELLTALDVPRRDRFAARFPRMAYWLASSGTVSALALGLWASAIAMVAGGVIPGAALWFSAAALTLVAAYRAVIEAVHAATCPCVSRPGPAPWDETGDDVEGGE
jgi:hypothetical protein